MPDLLLELFSEEIPARMQARASDDLKKMVTDRLVAAGLVYEGAKAFATPRRLALTVQGIPARQPDQKEERKGPKVGAPEQAIAGFMKAAGLTSIDQAKVQADKKGDFYVAITEKKGRDATEVIAEMIPEIVRAFPWPKQMRWGAASAKPGALTWVRPLHSIIATFGPETEEPVVLPFDVDGLKAGDETRGHRFMAPASFKVRRFDDYVASLEKAKVVLDAERRMNIIRADAKTLASAQNYELVEDEGLTAEVAGLVEWPVPLMGSFDASFLAIPGEVIRSTIRANQKCFVLRDPSSAKLVNKFILVSNIEASDGGKAIVAGNERVIRARLSDAKFFYETDLKTKLEDRLPKFENIVFHEKLGSQAERIARIVALARTLGEIIEPQLNVGQRLYNGSAAEYHNQVQKAAQLCKADLLTEVVGEFPELQGLMGRYYAEAQGEPEMVARAIEDHYRPKGPEDRVPSDPVAIAVALADKIDTLVGFWAIDEKPTGSKDPYALRRAALGVVRLIIANELRLPLTALLGPAGNGIAHTLGAQKAAWLEPVVRKLLDQSGGHELATVLVDKLDNEERRDKEADEFVDKFIEAIKDLLAFFADRLKVQLREQGARHDLVDAVFALEGQDDLLMVVRRVEALGKFLETDDGKNLLAGVKRASNILRIEEKKDGKSYNGAVEASLLKEPEEKALASAIAVAKQQAAAAVAKEDFAAAMSALATLRPAVDAFFDKVKVNDDDAAVRANRLTLLNEIREATRAVADFSRIEG